MLGFSPLPLLDGGPLPPRGTASCAEVIVKKPLSNKRLLLSRVIRKAGGPLAYRLAPLVSTVAAQQNRETLATVLQTELVERD